MSLPHWLQRHYLRAYAKLWWSRAVRAATGWKDHDLRWSYLAVGGLIVLAFLANLFLPHGWTAWPFVAAVGGLLYVHEAAERNGQGVPPMHVYALFAAGVGAWLVVATVLAVFNPLIILAGLGYLAYTAARYQLKLRAAKTEIARRRQNGLCVFCGEPADPAQGICMNCGEEPDPEGMQVARIQAVVKNSAGKGRMLATLRQDSLGQSASKKEAALLARSKYRQRRT